MKNKNRLTLFSEQEIYQLYSLPTFTRAECNHHFSFNKKELEAMNLLQTLSARFFFGLQLGYFKAKRIFFNFEFHQVKEDALFILSHYFPNEQLPAKEPNKNTQTAIRKKILALTAYNNNKQMIELELYQIALEICRLSMDPKIIAEKILQHIKQSKMVLIAYSTIQDLVGKAIKDEQKRLFSIIENNLPKDTKIELV